MGGISKTNYPLSITTNDSKSAIDELKLKFMEILNLKEDEFEIKVFEEDIPSKKQLVFSVTLPQNIKQKKQQELIKFAEESASLKEVNHIFFPFTLEKEGFFEHYTINYGDETPHMKNSFDRMDVFYKKRIKGGHFYIVKQIEKKIEGRKLEDSYPILVSAETNGQGDFMTPGQIFKMISKEGVKYSIISIARENKLFHDMISVIEGWDFEDAKKRITEEYAKRCYNVIDVRVAKK